MEYPQAPRGIPQIEVTFDIDANGILHVTAKDLGTGKEQKIRIEASSGLTDQEIDRMVKEAEKHAEEDKKARELAEARNNADNLIYSLEKLLNENKERIPESDASEIKTEIENLREALKGNDLNSIKEATEKLQQASHKVSQILYEQAAKQNQQSQEYSGEQGGEGEGETSEQEQSEEDVVDADYEVVDEDKNE